MRNLNREIAFLTTKVISMILGGAAYIAFFCTLRPFFMLVFAMLSLAGWYAVYTFILELKTERSDYMHLVNCKGCDKELTCPCSGHNRATCAFKGADHLCLPCWHDKETKERTAKDLDKMIDEICDDKN